MCQVPQKFWANFISGFSATNFFLVEWAFVEIFKGFDFRVIKKNSSQFFGVCL
jgi:hypothetical protein